VVDFESHSVRLIARKIRAKYWNWKISSRGDGKRDFRRDLVRPVVISHGFPESVDEGKLVDRIVEKVVSEIRRQKEAREEVRGWDRRRMRDRDRNPPRR
jgi:hypothetical protein